jgi:hypothetical protein
MADLGLRSNSYQGLGDLLQQKSYSRFRVPGFRVFQMLSLHCSRASGFSDT